jgi:hypothetical protein
MDACLARMPALAGDNIRIEFRSDLRSCNRRLESGPGRGLAVHAATFLRLRRIVLDAALARQPAELRRILVHELFHFVWLRTGNAVRRSWESVLSNEIERGARGELGWSAERRKIALGPRDRRSRTRAWRGYACESFCDRAAWLWAGCPQNPEFTLARRFCDGRKTWFAGFVPGRDLPV